MLFRKLIRTALKYKAQFISMIVMIAIGVGVFVGFNMEWYSLVKDTSDFFAQTDYADYRIYNEQGFSEEDAAAVRGIDGVTQASRVLSVDVGVKGEEKSVGLVSLEDYVVSRMLVTEGAEYDGESLGFWMSDKFASANGYRIGDPFTVTYRNVEIGGEIVGLAKSGEFLVCVSGDNQLMPDYTTYGFVYVSPAKIEEALGFRFYPQINILSDLDKADLEEKINGALGKTTLLLSKDEDMAYASAQSEVEEGQTMGSILPVLFLLIAVLTMATTMHRITANEKTQIGTLKALGYRDRRILRHYTSYGLVIGIVGAVIGLGLGFGIAAIILSPGGMMATYFDIPAWNLYVPWFCWLVLALTVAFLTLISFLSVKKMLKGTAADALRPYAPKKMKAMAVEKTKGWNKLPFGVKWNLRDVMRHKSRSLMTLIGVIGCMVLIVGGMGMSDTMNAFLDVIGDVNAYSTRVNLVETAQNSEALALAERYGGDWLASSSVSLNGEAVTLEIYDTPHDYVRFIDKNNRQVKLSDDGVYICIRLSENIKPGDTIRFSPYGGEETYTVKVAGVIRSVMTENVAMTKAYAESANIPYRINAVFTDADQSEIAADDVISGTQSNKAVMESYDSFMEIMNVMVLVLVVAALVLGVVVLYNLGVMSYVERYRELATLKVVGFRDKHIGGILISQNIWLTVVGVIVGLPAGVGVLYWLITALAAEYELKLVLGPLSYIVSVVLTFGVSLVVGLFVARKNKKIDMVEALKGAE